MVTNGDRSQGTLTGHFVLYHIIEIIRYQCLGPHF